MLPLDRLITAYTNEKSTRRLLKYDHIVEEFNRAVVDYICNPQSSKDHSQVARMIQEIEIERIKYFVKEYIMCRFDKIRRNFFLDLELMSSRERAFYTQYLGVMKQKDVFTDKPSQDFEFIGFISHKALEGVKIDNEVVEIFQGDFFVANYDDVVEYLKEDAIGLV